MNNSQLIENTLQEDKEIDVSPMLRERITQLTEIIEALVSLSQSNYWQVLRQYEFDGDLLNLVSRLEKEDDTVKIFRLQGEIERARKYDLVKLLELRRKELERTKNKLKHEPNY